MGEAQTAAARSVAEIRTAHAARYLGQLCKHFAHRCKVTLQENDGTITFPELGGCRLRAEPGVLTLALAAPEGPQLERLQDTIARHLLRFAFREEMAVDWRPA